MIDKNVFFSQKKESFSLEDFIFNLRTNITRNELVSFQKDFKNEIKDRTSQICEMIPGKPSIYYF